MAPVSCSITSTTEYLHLVLQHGFGAVAISCFGTICFLCAWRLLPTIAAKFPYCAFSPGINWYKRWNLRVLEAVDLPDLPRSSPTYSRPQGKIASSHKMRRLLTISRAVFLLFATGWNISRDLLLRTYLNGSIQYQMKVSSVMLASSADIISCQPLQEF